MTEGPTYDEKERKISELEQEISTIRESVQDTEERFRALSSRLFDTMYTHDFEGRFLDVSDAVTDLTGYSREEAKNMKFSDIIPEDRIPNAMETTREIQETGYQKKPNEYLIRRKDGSRIWIETKGSLMYREGRPYAIQGIARDITERKRAEELMKERESRYRTIFENTGSASLIIADDTTVMLVNSNLTRLTGYSKEEIEGKLSWTAFVAPEDVEMMKKYHILRRNDPASAPSSYEFTLVTRSGERRNIFLTVGTIPETWETIASCVDITDRKRWENELKESEERFRALQEASSGGIIIHEMGVVLDCNQSILDMTGYTRDELMGMNGLDLIAPAWREHVEKLISTDYNKPYDVEGIRKDGSVYPVEIKGKNLPYHGRVARVTEMRDISIRKQAEHALRSSEERYRSMLDNMEEAYYEVDLKGDFTFFNATAIAALGYTDEEMKGMNFHTFVDRENGRKVFEQYHQVFATGRPIKGFEWEVTCRDGGKIPVESSVSLITDRDGNPLGFRGVVRDISERIKAGEALRDSEERFRDLAKMLPETVFETDETGRLTFVNEAGFEKFGYAPDDHEKIINCIHMLVPEDRDRGRTVFQSLMKGGRVGLAEYTGLRKDGTTFPVLVHAAVIMRGGRFSGIRGFIIDISDKKSLEEQFIRAQKMEAIGKLAGGIAHDFNNLLTGILGNVSLMLMGIDSTHPFYDRLRNMEEYVKQGSDLTKQFLGFARGGKYEVKPTDLGEFVGRSSEMFGRTRKEVRIHQQIHKDLWSVEVDRGQMEQVLLNIFVNAWQAMPGGGDIYLCVDNCEVREEVAVPQGISAGRFVRVSVTDTGIGMDEATRARVFEPFFTTKEKGRGTGLGLASVYGIVRNHRGFITVESAKGVGSTFVVYLPASGKEVRNEQHPTEDLKKGGETILLVDDESFILDVGAQILAHLGYKVITASGGHVGLNTYQGRKDEIDLVVLDMIMPDLGGRETFEKLKEMDPGVKVLLSSGYSIDGQAQKILEKGCKGFIQKPFSVGELAGKIREVLDSR